MSILLLPVALVLGFPFMVGVLTASLKLFRAVRKMASTQTAVVVVFCVLAACAGMMTAPYWVLGTYGYYATVAVYVLFVGIGVPKFTKLIRFLKRELDSDSSNDVPVPEDK